LFYNTKISDNIVFFNHISKLKTLLGGHVFTFKAKTDYYYYYYYSLLAQQLYKTTLYRTQIQRGKKKKKKGLIHITKEHETNQIIDN
jgi:hypothetical protein